MSDQLLTLVTAVQPYRDINGVARIRSMVVDTISCTTFNAPPSALSFSSGSISAPSFTIGGNIGVFKSAPNELSFAANGTVMLSINPTALTVSTMAVNAINSIGVNDNLTIRANGTGVLSATAGLTVVGTLNVQQIISPSGYVSFTNLAQGGAVFSSVGTGIANTNWINTFAQTVGASAAVISGTFLETTGVEWRPTIGSHINGLTAWNPLWINTGNTTIFGSAFASNAAINGNKVYVVGNFEVVGISRATKFTIGALDVIQASAGKVQLGGLVFPTNATGTVGQILTSDGTGNVVWGAPVLYVRSLRKEWSGMGIAPVAVNSSVLTAVFSIDNGSSTGTGLSVIQLAGFTGSVQIIYADSNGLTIASSAVVAYTTATQYVNVPMVSSATSASSILLLRASIITTLQTAGTVAPLCGYYDPAF